MDTSKLQATLFESRDRVALITLNRVKKLNSMNQQIIDDLNYIMDELENDDSCRVLVITGAGKAFCAGGDMNAEIKMDVMTAFHGGLIGQRLLNRIQAFPKPVIAAINGFCLGGGMELALASDIRFCSDKAKLGLTEVNMGVIPGCGGSQRLPRLIGASKAKMVMMSGLQYTAAEAYEIGMVDKVVPADKLMDEVMAYAKNMAAKPPLALEYVKRAVDEGGEMNLEQGLVFESALFAHLYSTEDQHEAMAAFLEKRAPKPFQGK